jgi:hypothetical protein
MVYARAVGAVFTGAARHAASIVTAAPSAPLGNTNGYPSAPALTPVIGDQTAARVALTRASSGLPSFATIASLKE